MVRTKSGLYLPESMSGKGLKAPPLGEEKKEEEPILPEKYARSDCMTCSGQGTVKTFPAGVVILCICVEKRIRSNKGPRR
jgi:hypothetical protein